MLKGKEHRWRDEETSRGRRNMGRSRIAPALAEPPGIRYSQETTNITSLNAFNVYILIGHAVTPTSNGLLRISALGSFPARINLSLSVKAALSVIQLSV